MTTTRPLLLIFDLDGTLIDSVPDLALAINLALEDLALPACPLEQIRLFVGNGSLILCQRVLTYLQKDNTLAEKLHTHFLAHYAKYACHASTPYPDVSDGLITLKQAGYRLALATNKPMQFVPYILEKLQLTGFEMVLGGDSLPTKKPDPAPLLYIADKLNIPSNQAIMIGDSKNDILAGKNANMTTLALSYGYNHGEPITTANPNKIFDDFKALTTYLLTLKDER